MIRGLLCLLLLISSAGVQAQDPVEPAADPVGEQVKPGVVWLPPAIVAFGDVDDHLVTRTREWAGKNLAIPVEVLPAQPMNQLGSLDEVSQVAAAMLETNRIGIVVVWRPNSEVMNHGAYYPELRVAVVNLNPMLTPETDSEIIERRIDRQVIRGICMMFGLEPSPNPYSAMFNYQTLEDLDTIGRNLDPPWLIRLQEKAVELGIPVDAENEFNMIQ